MFEIFKKSSFPKKNLMVIGFNTSQNIMFVEKKMKISKNSCCNEHHKFPSILVSINIPQNFMAF